MKMKGDNKEMYCQNCGKEIADTALFCKFCGTKQNRNFTAPAQAETEIPSVPEMQESEAVMDEQVTKAAPVENQSVSADERFEEPVNAPKPVIEDEQKNSDEQNIQQQSYQQSDYQQNNYQQNAYQQGGYQQGSYQQGGYQQNGYQQGGYQQNGYQQGGYQQGAYQQRASQQAEWLNQKAGQFKAGTKNMFSEILPILKNPVSRVSQLSSEGNTAVGIEFIIAKTIVFILAAILLMVKLRASAVSAFGNYSQYMGDISQYVKIPVFRILLLVIIATAGVDLLEALLMRAFGGIVRGRTTFAGTITAVGVKSLYEGLIFLVCGIIALGFPIFGVVLGAVFSMIVPFIEYHAYVAAVQGNDDRKPYAFFLVKLSLILIVTLLMLLLAGDLITGTAFDSLSYLF